MPKTCLLGSLLCLLLAACCARGDDSVDSGSVLRAVKDLQTHGDPRTRARAAQVLGKPGCSSPEVIQALASALADADPEVALHAATALGRIGSPAAAELPALIKSLDNDNEHVCYAAAWSVNKIIADFEADSIAFTAEQFDAQFAQLAAAESKLRKAGAWRPVELISEAVRTFQDFAPPGAQPVRSETADQDDSPKRSENLGSESPAKALLRRLNSDDAFDRIQAAHQLGQLGVEGVPAMLEALRIAHRRSQEATEFDHHMAIWPVLSESLQRVGSRAAPQLAEALTEPATQYIVRDVLSELGPLAHTATPKLIELLADKQLDPECRTCAAMVLATIGPPAEQAVEPLLAIALDEAERDEVRCAAVNALAGIGKPARSTIPKLIPVMEDRLDSDCLRVEIAGLLGRSELASADAVPALLARLEDETELEHVQAAAADSLAAYGNAAQPAADALVGLLDQGDLSLCEAAARALTALDRPPAEATAPLLRLLAREDGDEDTQTAIGAALVKIGPTAMDALVDQLRSPDEDLQARTAAVVARIGSPADKAVEPLLEILDDDSSGAVRQYAIIALGRLGPASAPAVDSLAHLTASTEEPVRLRAMAATALGELETVAETSAATLAQVMHDRQAPSEVRAACALSIARVSPEGTAELLRGLKSDQPVLQIAAARALYEADLARTHALPVMLASWEDGVTGFVAAQMLREIGDDAVRHLCDTVRDEQLAIDTRRTAIRMLGNHYELGKLRAETAAVLIEAMRDKDLRDEAEVAIQGVGPQAIPLLLAELENSSRQAGKLPPPQEDIRDIVLNLCVPTGEGGADGWFDDPTGFAEYDRLGLYDFSPPKTAPFKMFEGGRGRDLMVPEMSAEPEEVAEAPAPLLEPEQPETTPTGFKTVKVFYGTNRQAKTAVPPSVTSVSASLLPAAIAGLATMLFGLFSFAASRSRLHSAIVACGLVTTVVLAYGSFGTSIVVEGTAGNANVQDNQDIQYTGLHSDELQIGKCEVTIPDVHQRGQLEAPSLLRLELREDPLKHVVLQRVERYEPDTFFTELRSDLKQHENSILVFVHGYNVTFEDAARRTAQMSYDLEFQGAPMFYSWPSHGNWYRYREDEENVELAVKHIKRFLLDVVHRSEAKSIHLIAHSMGNRALTGALREIQSEADGQQAMFNQVVLAAPDINAEVFEHSIAPAIAHKAQRVTLYASSNDLALTASQAFNVGGPRAGDTSAGPVIYPGIETIDVSKADTSLLGHSYYGSNESVLDDLKLLLQESASADQRPGLDAVAGSGGKYWIYSHPRMATRPDVPPASTR